MNKYKMYEDEFLFLKIIQSGEIIKIVISDKNLRKNLKEFYVPILKELKVKEKDVFISNEESKMLGNYDLELPLNLIIKKFGNNLKLYSEKIF
ncbi:MAG: hypothetical protein KAT66_04405 [Candidatus Lokiarchaeota archaeon]|nr:hypothetical protein [Candidatus Lokiarchaeota archaeon]